MKVWFKRLDERVKDLYKGSKSAAGTDLRALLDSPLALFPRETKAVHTGIAVAIPDGYVGLVFARSGLSCKKGLAPANKVGVIDSDYRGEIIVYLHNDSQSFQIIEPDERIAQLVVVPYMNCEFEEVEHIGITERGTGGFGSTGTI